MDGSRSNSLAKTYTHANITHYAQALMNKAQQSQRGISKGEMSLLKFFETPFPVFRHSI
jgi:hypothetical protein